MEKMDEGDRLDALVNDGEGDLWTRRLNSSKKRAWGYHGHAQYFETGVSTIAGTRRSAQQKEDIREEVMKKREMAAKWIRKSSTSLLILMLFTMGMLACLYDDCQRSAADPDGREDSRLSPLARSR